MIGSVNIWTWLGLFVVYLLCDILYAQFVFAVSKLQALRSANLSLLMYVLTFWGTIEYVKNPWYALPIALGSWLGTYVTVWNEKRKNIKEKSNDL